KFGSFMVHFRRVPAGRTVSRALALRVRLRMVNPRRDTARTAYELDFMTSPRSHAPGFWYVFQSYRVEPAPINELIHKLTLPVNRPIGIKVCLFCNWRLTACPASPFTP